jgi:hypothetical protein
VRKVLIVGVALTLTAGGCHHSSGSGISGTLLVRGTGGAPFPLPPFKPGPGRVVVFRVEPSSRTRERVILVHVGRDGHFIFPLSPGRYVLEARNVLIARRVHAPPVSVVVPVHAYVDATVREWNESP